MSITYSRRRLTREAIDQVYEIERSSFRGDYLWTRSRFHEVVNKHGMWVAYASTQPVGYLIAWKQRGCRCYIAGLAVSKRFRGQGIGAQLIKRAERSYDCTQIGLDVDVNNDAQLLYYRLGFRITRHSKKHRFISMSKRLRRSKCRSSI